MRTRNNEEHFESTIAKISVAQICESTGFATIQSSALESLSNIATRYLGTLAKFATSSANSSGRTQCNLFDVVSALIDLNGGGGGASNVKKSRVLMEIMKFVRSIDEIPFAKPIPRRNFIKRSAGIGIQEQFGGFSHIPLWAPRFPDPTTYKNLDVRVCKRFIEEEKDRGGVDVEKNVNVVEKKKSFLPVKRKKVRFKFGLDSGLEDNVELGMRNGVCRGGKRVSWRNVSPEDEIKSFSRRRR